MRSPSRLGAQVGAGVALRPAGRWMAVPLSILAIGLASATAARAQAASTPGVRVLPTGGVGMEAAALLLSGQQGGTVPLAVLAMPVGPAADGVDVALVTDIDGAALLADQTSSPLVVQVSAYALGKDATQVQASLLDTVEVDLGMHQQALERGGLRLVGRLTLQPGETSLRVLVRNLATGAVGLRVTPLSVPTLAAERPVLLGPLFSVVPEGWLTAVASAGGTMPPWLAELPGARPVIAADQPASFRLIASSALVAGPLRVQVRRGEELAAELPATVTAREPGPAAGLELLTVSFRPGVAAGGEVTLSVAAGGGETVSPAVAVVVADARQAAGRGSATPASPAPPPRTPRTHRAAERQLMASYREALRLLTGDDPATARAAVVALEAPVLSQADMDDVAELAAMELEVLRRLASAEPGSLLPVIDLYLGIYHEQVRGRERLLSTHAREMVLRLAELQAANDGSLTSRHLAASALLALVGAAPTSASQAFLARALLQVLSYDPGDRTALLCAAINAERQGSYAAATDWLEKLRHLDDGDLEVRVRLAINRARSGDRKQARALLAGVVASPAAAAGPPAWWLSLAYQELARLHLDAEDAAAAEKVLRRGLERFPGEEKMSLQLARLLAERGAQAEAARVLDALVASATDRGFDSARHRYALLPTEPLEAAAAEVRERAAASRSRLAAALDATAGSGPAR